MTCVAEASQPAANNAYTENDGYIGPRLQKLWFESFRSAGGRGQLVVVPPFPERRGHAVFSSHAGVPLWTAAVAGFFKTLS